VSGIRGWVRVIILIDNSNGKRAEGKVTVTLSVEKRSRRVQDTCIRLRHAFSTSSYFVSLCLEYPKPCVLVEIVSGRRWFSVYLNHGFAQKVPDLRKLPFDKLRANGILYLRSWCPTPWIEYLRTPTPRRACRTTGHETTFWAKLSGVMK
jgi:hypothetical protein